MLSIITDPGWLTVGQVEACAATGEMLKFDVGSKKIFIDPGEHAVADNSHGLTACCSRMC